MSENPLDDVTYAIETPLGAPTRVEYVLVDEALSEPYAALVDIAIDDAAALRDDLLGQDVVIDIHRAERVRRVCGLVRMVRQLDSPAVDKARFRLEVVPALALLALRRNTRIFQGKTVPEIIGAVLREGLAPYGRHALDELDAEYDTREYCVQYQESDLDFVHRLMEEEGIYYCFTHEGAEETMFLRDDNAACPKADGAEDPVAFDPRDEVIVGPERVVSFRRARAATTTAVAVRDFDWTRAGHVVSGAAPGDDPAGKTRESYEHGRGRSLTIHDYDAGERRYREHDADHQAVVRRDAHRHRENVFQGLTRVVGLAPGTTFELTGHPVAGFDGEYLVLRVCHRDRPARVAGQEQSGTYHNDVECIPLAVPYRPARRTPKPSIASIQTAVVTGPSGEEIHTDEHGRVKVQFHWDRESPADDTSSCWVRVQQKWAGAGWGFWWLPRIGMEVVVQFIDGDPDRPLVTGAVYDGNNMLPYPLPDEKTKSTIKSNSSPGGGGFNELRFEDKKGSEEIYTHAQKDYNEDVLNDHTTKVGHDQKNHVKNNQKQTIHANQRENVDANQRMTVGGDRTVHVEGDYDETVDGTETRHVVGDVSETFAASETRLVGGDLTEDVGASETRAIGASQTETIGGDKTQTIGAASDVTIGAALTELVSGAVTLETPASWTMNVAGALTIVTPASLSLTAAAGWRVMAPGGVTQIDAGKDWTGFFWRAKGAFAREVFGVKFESFGATFTYVDTKIGIAGAVVPQLGLKLEMGNNKDGKFGAKLTGAAADIHSWGAELEG